MNQNSFIKYRKHRKFTRFFIILLLCAGFVLPFADEASGQQIPCLDLRSEGVKFFKPERKTLRGVCRNRQTNASAKAESVNGAISVSGHVTHQNGVRMSGITMTLIDLDKDITRTVETDEMGNYLFQNLIFGTRYQLTPSREGYEFYPPSIIWEGIVEDEVENFIAVGPPPEEPPDPPGTPILAWTSYYNGEADSADYNAMIGRDAAGNIYLGGTSVNDTENGGTDIVISKIDANGNLLWSKSFNGTADYQDGLRDMKVDAAGNVYLTGYTYTQVTVEDVNHRSYDYVTQKYDTEGNLLWSKNYGHNIDYDDFPRSLKIDANGNVYVTGFSWAPGVFADYATLKYDTDGNLVWEKRYSSPFGDGATEVDVDAQGNVYVTGSTQNGAQGGSEDILTIKYDSDGNEIWQNLYNSQSNDEDEGLEVEIDSAGNVYVLGYSYVDFVNLIVIRKINGVDGTDAWTQTYDVPGSFEGSLATALKLDANGNVIVTGMTNLTNEFYNIDAFTAKFNTDGVFQWLKTFDGVSDEDYDGDTKLTLDADGNIYIGITSEGFANPDIRIIKYSPEGDEQWMYRFGNPFFGGDVLLGYNSDVAQPAMLLDEQGNLYIAGDSAIPGQASDMVAFKIEPVAQARSAAFDFDGDKKAEIAVFRPETGVWHFLRSSDGGYTSIKWGLEGDKIVPADYDGDGKNDLAVYRGGVWYVQKSSDGGFMINQFGLQNDTPVPSDFDNDGHADLGVFRQGVWHQLMSSNGSYKALQFGLDADVPIPSDYDRNRRSDVAVYREGVWYVQYQAELPINAFQFGINSDIPIPADFDGDGQTDYAVFRDGIWYVRRSRSGSLTSFQWGLAGDIPVPADYDGDKKTDYAVYRRGVWYILNSSDNSNIIVQFGLETDVPVPAAYIR